MKRYKRDDSIVGRKIADEYILVPTKQNAAEIQCMYTLNDIGGRIWELLDDVNSVERIVAAIAQEYRVEVDIAEFDVLEFLDQLEDIGAVTLMSTNERQED
ncbi:PqqD family protein [Chloroflexota bacterium]